MYKALMYKALMRREMAPSGVMGSAELTRVNFAER